MNKEFNENAKIVLNTLNIHNQDELKTVYHFLAKYFHPDNTNDDGISFKNLHIFYEFFNNHFAAFINIENAHGDFYESLNYILNSCKFDKNNTNDLKSIYNSLIEYATKTNQKELIEVLNAAYNKINIHHDNNDTYDDYNKYKKQVQEFVRHYYAFDPLTSIKQYIEFNAINIIKKYSNRINNLVNNVYVSIDNKKNKTELDNYMRDAFVTNYKDIILTFINEYLNYYQIIQTKINMKLEEYNNHLNNHIKQMTFKEVCEELNLYIGNMQKRNCQQVKSTFKQLQKETKGILNHLYRCQFIDAGVFSEYCDKYNRAESIQELNEVYQDLYINHYYNQKLESVKEKIMIKYANFLKSHLGIDQLQYINIYKRIFETIESQTDVMDSKTLRTLEQIDFNDISTIDNILNDMEGKKQEYKTFAK